MKAFGRFGWVCVRQTGSHAILEKKGVEPTLSIPCGNKDVKRHLLAAQLKLAGISIPDYCKKFR